jgi:hypothetical protein
MTVARQTISCVVAAARGLTKNVRMPDFYKALHLDSLEAVKTQAVTMFVPGKGDKKRSRAAAPAPCGG